MIVLKMNISGLEQEANIKWASFRADLRLCNSDPFQAVFYFQNFNLSFKYRQYFCFRPYIIVKHFLPEQPKSIMPLPWRESINVN